MEKTGESGPKDRFTLVFLNLASLMLVLGSVYMVEELSILYGIGAGAIVQSVYDHNATIAASVAPAAQQLLAIHNYILEAYVLFIVAMALMAGAFLMFIKRNERGTSAQSRYVPYHAAMVAVYVLLLYLVVSTPYTPAENFYMDVTYAGIVICFACDGFLEYLNRKRGPSRSPRMLHTMVINPSTPFSNLINLRESIFSKLTGHLRIVDKHFNSTALTNLHRLIEQHQGNFTRITILTSKEMLDADIGSSISDFKSELAGNGTGLEVKLMDEKDAVDQHERIMLDDKIAYKVPPFNIINKKSEHITTISYDHASRRFAYLYQRAIKLENYMAKMSRQGNEKPDGEKAETQ
jgi:hypothetical protein